MTISDPIAHTAAERGEMLPDFDPYDDPGYAAHIEEMEREEERARQRRGDYPLRWGQPLTGDRYFCGACWLNGVEGGAHPYDCPPCDPITQRRHFG